MLNFFKKNKNITLSYFDSGVDYSEYQIDNMTPDEIIYGIESIKDITVFKSCTFSYAYISEILSFINHTEALFKNCVFKVDTKPQLLALFQFTNLKRCSIYISKDALVNSSLAEHFFDLWERNDNFLIFNEYFHHLIEVNHYNVSELTKRSTSGVFLKDIDLSNVKLPNDRDFFLKTYNRHVRNVIFKNVDFTSFNLKAESSPISFENCAFEEGCIFTSEFFHLNFTDCIFSHINFNIIKEPSNVNMLNCIFTTKSALPKDKDFFVDSNIIGCTLPEGNYQKYSISENTFRDCSFPRDAILPNYLFTKEYMPITENIRCIPSSYIRNILEVGSKIARDKQFKNQQYMFSDEELYIYHQLQTKL